MAMRKGASSPCLLFLFFFFTLVLLGCPSLGHPNYKDALAKSILFFQGQSEQKQGLSSSIAFQAYASYLTMLGVLIQVKFEGDSASLFEKHNAIIYSFVVVISIFTGTIILGKKFEMKTIEPIGLLSGAMAPILLLLILVPIFGWLLLVLWIFFAAKMGWDSLHLKLFCEASDGPRNSPEEGSQELPRASSSESISPI